MLVDKESLELTFEKYLHSDIGHPDDILSAYQQVMESGYSEGLEKPNSSEMRLAQAMNEMHGATYTTNNLLLLAEQAKNKALRELKTQNTIKGKLASFLKNKF